MKKQSLLLIFLFVCKWILCQTDSTNHSTVSVIKDNRIDSLNKRYQKSFKLKGYRVQIYSGTKRPPARQIRARFKNNFTEIAAHENWEPPYYKVKVGDFKTKLEALKFQMEIKEEFPNSFIVKDIIDYDNMPK